MHLKMDNSDRKVPFASVSMTALASGTVSARFSFTANTVYFAGGGGGVAPSLIKATNANATPHLPISLVPA
jgi:hypothetical protein